MTFHTTAARRTLRRASLASLAAMGCLTTFTAHAQAVGQAYGGVSGGRSSGSFGRPEQVLVGLTGAPNETEQPAAVTGFSHDRRDSGYKAFLGWRLAPMLALEGGYFHLGSLGYQASTTPLGTTNARFNVQGVNLDLVGIAPISPHWSALARVGVQAARTRASFANTGALALENRSERGTNAKFGVGLEYAVGSVLRLRAEAERYRIHDAMGGRANINLVSLGLVLPFGTAPATMRPAALRNDPPPAARAAAPEPAPVVAVVPAPVAAPAAEPAPRLPQRMSLSAESLFGFDHATVLPAGRTALDSLVRALEGATLQQMVVEGHTDRLGAAPHNQVLSQQRADAVKTYLVTSGHVDPMKISAAGKGESSPVTQLADCPGHKATAALVQCLQPDRRVDIAVQATR